MGHVENDIKSMERGFVSQDGLVSASPYACYVHYLKSGKLAYQRERTSGRAIFYPRVISPSSGEADLEWMISQGKGIVYATTAVHHRDEAPLNVVLVDMDEGFRLMSRVEGLSAQAVRIGMRVRLSDALPDSHGEPYPVFVLDEPTAE